MLLSVLLAADLIELVSHQLTVGPCQSFRRPTAPTESVVSDVPAMAAFSKAALEGGIEHDSVQRLYQVAPPSGILSNNPHACFSHNQMGYD